MKEGLPGDTLQPVVWELSRGVPFRCTPVWISAASVLTSICLTKILVCYEPVSALDVSVFVFLEVEKDMREAR